MVFAVPTDPGTYRGFAYEVIAARFNDRDLVNTLEISAFNGRPHHPEQCHDGQRVRGGCAGLAGRRHECAHRKAHRDERGHPHDRAHAALTSNHRVNRSMEKELDAAHSAASGSFFLLFDRFFS